MSNNITPDMLANFIEEVERAAQTHLGRNGIKAIAIGVDRSTYFDTYLHFISQQSVPDAVYDHGGKVLPYFGDFACVVPVETYGQFVEVFRGHKWKA